MWMYTVLPRILNMSLTASIVIVFVLLARLLLTQAPKTFSYFLWAAVLFRLICPVSLSSEFSILNIFDAPVTAMGSIEYIPPDTNQVQTPTADLSIPSLNEANHNLPQGEYRSAAALLKTPLGIATFIWLAGIAGMLIYSVFSLLRLRRKLVGAGQWYDNIYLADHIASPFVMGLICPKIYLPSALMEKERAYIIQHEQTHIRRGDHVIKAIAFLALTVHWFNPLVWLAFALLGKDMEMSCDEVVLKKMGGDIRADYSSSLLRVAIDRHISVGIPLAFGEGDTKKRIKNVMKYKRPALWVTIIAAFAVIVVCMVLIANPRHNRIMINDALYEEGDETTTELPSGSVEIGILENILHNRTDTPEHNFQGVGLNEKYAGNSLYQSGTDNAVIYLEDLSGFYIPFAKVQTDKETDPSDFHPYDTFSFSDLRPNHIETYKENLIFSSDNSEFRYIVTWTRTGLAIEVGLVSQDGAEYMAEAVSGSVSGTIDHIPAGTYQVVVRNSESNLQYKETSDDLTVTGAIGFETESGYVKNTLHNLSQDGVFATTAVKVSDIELSTNSEKITVSISNTNKTILIELYSVDSEQAIMTFTLDTKNRVNTFTNLTAATHYYLTAAGDDNANITVSE